MGGIGPPPNTMHEADWIKEARRRCSADLFLCRNQVQANRVGVHPECIQVWDRAPDSHEPYFVLAIHEGGFPRGPSDIDIMRLQGMSSDREHQGRKGWIHDIDRGGKGRFDTAEHDYARRVNEYFSPGGEGHEKVQRLARQRIVVANTVPQNQGHNLRKRIPR